MRIASDRLEDIQVGKTTVLFLCPDNALLGPLAEAYLNFRARGLMRAFSAGTTPAATLNRHVTRVLSANGIDPRGLAPKPVDVFLLPHAVVPDRVIYLSDMDPVTLPPLWKPTTSSHWWNLAARSAGEEDFSACLDCFLKIRSAIDHLVDPSNAEGKTGVWDVA